MGNTYPRPQDQSPADFANKEHESAHAETGLRQNEPTDDWRRSPKRTHRGLRHRSTKRSHRAIGARKTNPPMTSTKRTHRRLGRSPKRTHRRLRRRSTKRTHRPNSKTKPNRARRSRLQNASIDGGRGTAAQTVGVVSDVGAAPRHSGAAKRRPAFPGNDRKHRRDRRARNKMSNEATVRGQGLAVRRSSGRATRARRNLSTMRANVKFASGCSEHNTRGDLSLPKRD